jgi:Ulp1 family protease
MPLVLLGAPVQMRLYHSAEYMGDVCTAFNMTITARDICRLRDTAWLNDEARECP